MSEHRFGGPWTEIKLDALTYYLEFFTKALSKKKFALWYIDAFAGTGERHFETKSGGFFESVPEHVEVEARAGSAKRALMVQPQFEKFVFIEADARRATALRTLEASFPGRRIEVHEDDANSVLDRLFSSNPWSAGSKNHRVRGVLFLDPYGMSVPWKTLETIAATQALDVWYLFPTGAVVRQLAHDFSKIDRSKADALDRVFGTPDWRSEFYKSEPYTDLFGSVGVSSDRDANPQKIEEWFRNRLETRFSFVSEPIPLGGDGFPQRFSLYFAMANPSPAAIRAAENCITSLFKKFWPQAFRRTSAP